MRAVASAHCSRVPENHLFRRSLGSAEDGRWERDGTIKMTGRLGLVSSPLHTISGEHTVAGVEREKSSPTNRQLRHSNDSGDSEFKTPARRATRTRSIRTTRAAPSEAQASPAVVQSVTTKGTKERNH